MQVLEDKGRLLRVKYQQSSVVASFWQCESFFPKLCKVIIMNQNKEKYFSVTQKDQLRPTLLTTKAWPESPIRVGERACGTCFTGGPEGAEEEELV